MFQADQCHHADSFLPKEPGHFDRHGVTTAGGNDQRGILFTQVKITKYPLGQTTLAFQEHRLPLAIGSHHRVVVGERQFHDRVEPGK